MDTASLVKIVPNNLAVSKPCTQTDCGAASLVTSTHKESDIKFSVPDKMDKEDDFVVMEVTKEEKV